MEVMTTHDYDVDIDEKVNIHFIPVGQFVKSSYRKRTSRSIEANFIETLTLLQDEGGVVDSHWTSRLPDGQCLLGTLYVCCPIIHICQVT